MILTDKEWDRLYELDEKINFVVFGDGRSLTPEEREEHADLMRKLFSSLGEQTKNATRRE